MIAVPAYSPYSVQLERTLPRLQATPRAHSRWWRRTHSHSHSRSSASGMPTSSGADMPFEKLVEALLTRRDPSRSPLFLVISLLDMRLVERAI